MTGRDSYHHGNLREALLGAAVRLVEEKGIHGFSLRAAAREAGVAPSAPYRHFKDRAALLTAVAEEAIVRLKAATVEEMSGASPEPLEQFRAMGLAYVKFAVANPIHFKIMNEPEFCDPTQSEIIREIEEQAAAQIRAALDAAQSEGSATALGADAIALTASTLIYGLARRFVDGHFSRAGITPEDAETVAMLVTNVLGIGIANVDKTVP